MHPAAEAFDLDVVEQTDQEHATGHTKRCGKIGRRHDAEIFDLVVKPRDREDAVEQVNGQEVHRVHQENPDKHRQSQWADKLARFSVFDDAFGLAVDHFKQHFNCSLHAAGHTRMDVFSDAPHDEHTNHAKGDRPKNSVEVDNAEVDQAHLLFILQMHQMVTDIVTSS